MAQPLPPAQATPATAPLSAQQAVPLTPENSVPLDLLRPDAPLSLDPGQDPLERLRDIHLPPDVPFWPPAPGWFILAGLALFLVLFLLWREWRWRHSLAYKALKTLEAETHNAGSRATAAAAATVFRRILVSRGKTHEAALAGPPWQTFLQAGKTGLPEELALLVAQAPYLPPQDMQTANAADTVLRATLLKAAQRWVRSNA
ncbi:DUF4381 domain-containing protein [Xanthobacter sp. TB0139]|uniref:DUF4381 domain-containing protein n=1 Tax=Xanthobacter sp. TB0139 TaxID=3459178 RepID=UPI00403A7878